MKKINNCDFILIWTIIFSILNIIHIYFPIHLIIEDIKNKTMYGTNLEMMVLFPWLIEGISIPFIIIEAIILIICLKKKNINIVNLIIFSIFIFQTILFNVLLRF